MSRLVSSYFICLWEVVFCVLHAVINNHSQVRAVFVNIIWLTYMLLLREIINDGLILRYVINVDLWEQISPLTFPYWLLLLLTRSRDRSDWFFLRIMMFPPLPLSVYIFLTLMAGREGFDIWVFVPLLSPWAQRVHATPFSLSSSNYPRLHYHAHRYLYLSPETLLRSCCLRTPYISLKLSFL